MIPNQTHILHQLEQDESNTYTTSARTRSESPTAGTSGTVPHRDVQKPHIPIPYRKPLRHITS